MEYKFLSLAILVLSPLISMLLILSPIFPNNAVIIRRFSKWFAGLHFIYSLCFLLFFNPDLLSMSFPQEIIMFNSSWLKTMGITATFAVDGFSLLLCVLTTFLFLIALIVSKYSITSKHKLYYSLIMLLESSVLGVFCAKDIFLFFLFWQLQLIPMYFLILLWGKENAQKAAEKYLIYNSLGGIFLLFSILVLYYYSFTVSGVLTANIDALSFDEYINPIWFQITTFFGFFLAFASKFPLIPFHRWFVSAQKCSLMPVNIVLGATSLSMGAYGFIKFNMQIFPTAFKTLAVILMIIAVINIFFGAMIGFIKNNIKEIISFIYLAMGGFVLFGLSSVTSMGITGAIFQIFAVCLIFTGLFLVSGLIFLRTSTDDINKLGGIARVMPKLMYFSLPIGLGIIGTPLLIIFPSIIMIILGAFMTELFDQVTFQLGAIFVIFALLAISACVLRLLHKTFFGNILSEFSKIKDISTSEFIGLLMIVIPIIIFGVAPMILINLYNNVVSIIMDILRI